MYSSSSHSGPPFRRTAPAAGGGRFLALLARGPVPDAVTQRLRRGYLIRHIYNLSPGHNGRGSRGAGLGLSAKRPSGSRPHKQPAQPRNGLLLALALRGNVALIRAIGGAHE